MQQIIVDIIVAAAVLFLARWLYRGFVSKRHEKALSCGSCPKCETRESSDSRGAPTEAVESKG